MILLGTSSSSASFQSANGTAHFINANGHMGMISVPIFCVFDLSSIPFDFIVFIFQFCCAISRIYSSCLFVTYAFNSWHLFPNKI